MEVTIRVFKSGDKKAVIRIWNECGLVVPLNDPSKDIRRKLKAQADLFLVAEDGEDVVGTVMGGYEGHRGWINYLAVLPGRQGLGIGRLLMAEIEKRLKKAGCPKINLQIRESNRRVSRFYEKMGYVQDEVICYGKRLVRDDLKKETISLDEADP
jgi:ribosomal protein S18 acetylase RimI-like enzyme